MKEAIRKSLHIVWFYLHDISEKSKPVEAETDQWLSEAWEAGTQELYKEIFRTMFL